ncbi:MAG TPA: signal recognition particle protein [Actinomycetota bacterium]|jgi:signal recognition particle subunit SRP54|nr:signal recognition particle protein [Actinomycetota bacterium]
MFDTLSTRLDDIFTRLRSRGRLSEKQVDEVLREIRLALLEADVSLKVVKAFVKDVRERAEGAEIHKSLTPAQQVIKLVHAALIDVLGHEAAGLEVTSTPPRVILMAGLQGSGKTTASAKLGLLLKGQGRKPMLAACDLRRPAAIRQLVLLGEQSGVPVHAEEAGADAVAVAGHALKYARDEGFTDVVVDTAGRMNVDAELMAELGRVADVVGPTETLLVCDAMTGQDAVNVAEAFMEEVDITGVVLTKLDGDARGGAALSMSFVTGRPIKFAGVGEKLSDLEPFHPDRMASRILGMGDVMTLIEKAESAFDQAEAKKMEEKLRRAEFTFEDFLSQMQALKKMGPMSQVLGMLPGMSKLPVGDDSVDEQLPKIEAMIRSMTLQERNNPQLINGSRRRRIAAGSGTSVQEVNQLVKQFGQVRKMVKSLSGGKRMRLPGGMKLPPGMGM